MSKLQNINWHEEALAFCKKNGIHPSTVTLGAIELAMRRGAELVAEGFTVQIRDANESLAKLRKASSTQHETKVIML